MMGKMMQATAVCCMLIVSVSLLGCHHETDQDRARKVITGSQKAAEEKDVKEVLSYLSKTYSDPQGNNYDGIKDLLLFYFFRHQKVSVFITDLDITLNDASAKATFQAVLSGRNKASADDVLPEALGVYSFDVSLKKESGEWKIVSAQWVRVGEGPSEKAP